jgi:hypothetical protein
MVHLKDVARDETIAGFVGMYWDVYRSVTGVEIVCIRKHPLMQDSSDLDSKVRLAIKDDVFVMLVTP